MSFCTTFVVAVFGENKNGNYFWRTFVQSSNTFHTNKTSINLKLFNQTSTIRVTICAHETPKELILYFFITGKSFK